MTANRQHSRDNKPIYSKQDIAKMKKHTSWCRRCAFRMFEIACDIVCQSWIKPSFLASSTNAPFLIIEIVLARSRTSIVDQA